MNIFPLRAPTLVYISNVAATYKDVGILSENVNRVSYEFGSRATFWISLVHSCFINVSISSM